MEKNTQLIQFLIKSSLILFFSLFIFLPISMILNVFIENFNDFSFSFSIKTIVSIFCFSIYQAFFSASISLILGLISALIFYKIDFLGKHFLLKIYSILFFVPIIPIIFGFISIYGRSGWLPKIFDFFNLPYSFSLYGIFGILFIHVFLNFPFATNILYQELMQIPVNYYQLGTQIPLSRWKTFYIIEFLSIKKTFFSLFFLIFLVCFSSFIPILLLGGKNLSNFQIEIFRAFQFFEFPSLILYSFLQCFFAFLLYLIFFKYSFFNKKDKKQKISHLQSNFLLTNKKFFMCILFLIFTNLFLFLPFLSILIEGVFAIKNQFFDINLLLRASIISIFIAISAAFLSVFVTFMLSFSFKNKKAQFLSKIPLIIPSTTLICGFTILTFLYMPFFWQNILLLIFFNSFTAIPFIFISIDNKMVKINKNYELLIKSIKITFFQKIFWIYIKAMKTQLGFAFSISTLLSLADLGLILFIGNNKLTTLPFLLYQQLSSYQNKAAAVSSLLILAISLFIIIITGKLLKNDKT